MNNIRELNKNAYETEESLDKYSAYILYPNEKYLIDKYFLSEGKVLDLGCGAGRTTVRLFELGYDVTGIDLSNILIKAAKKRFPLIPFKEGNFCNIEELDGSFDYILVSHNSIDYAYPEIERERAIQEWYRVLKPNGILILSSHNIKSLFFSPYYLKHWKRVLWMIRNWIYAFKSSAYIFDLKMYTFFTSQKYCKNQFESFGFKHVEAVGFRKSNNYFFNNYFSPYIHYVFKK